MGNRIISERSWPFRWCLAVVLLLLWTSVVHAQTGAIVVRVEEDWELVVASPDPDTDAPQVVCVIAPTGHVQGLHAALELNQQSLPVHVPGGLQLQLWHGELPLIDKGFPKGDVLAVPGEAIRWTQSMSLSDNALTFEVINGSSTTWGAFGGQGYLKASVPTSLDNLDSYTPEVSVANSGVSFAGNRVTHLLLKQVRLYTSTGEVIVDETRRVVHSHE